MAELKKVAHVMRRMTTDRWGGTESVVLNLCRQLVVRGIDSVVFCTSIFSKAGEERIQGIKVSRHRYMFPWFGLSDEETRAMQLKGGSPLSFSLFFSLLREPGLSLIHTHVQHRLGGIARAVARWRGIPYVVSVHGGHHTLPEAHAARMREPFQGKWEWGKLFGWLLGARRTLQDADAILCVGQDEYEAMRTQYPHKLVCYAPNGVDIDVFEQADPALFRSTYNIGDDERLVLCVSRIDYQKNQVLLVRAFARFAQSHPKHKLVLVGPINVESYHQEILQTAKKLGIEERLLLIPGIEPGNPLLASAYRAADCFVLPSKMEPFGIVILEAWAAGVPVIASCVGGIPGFTHDGEDILLFPSDDEETLTAKLEQLAHDGMLRQALVEAGRTAVSAYSWEAASDRLIDIYRKVTG